MNYVLGERLEEKICSWGRAFAMHGRDKMHKEPRGQS